MKKYIVEIIAALLILLFMYAAVSKLLDYDTFKLQLGKSPYLSTYAASIAWLVPVTELIICIMLIVPPIRIAGFLASFFMMLLFTGYIYLMLYHSSYLPCSCGGILSRMSWEDHFYFNIVFTLLSLTGSLLVKQPNQRLATIDKNQPILL